MTTFLISLFLPPALCSLYSSLSTLSLFLSLSLSPGLVSMALVITLLHGHGFLIGQKVGMICRVMCTNAIYQKVSYQYLLTCIIMKPCGSSMCSNDCYVHYRY